MLFLIVTATNLSFQGSPTPYSLPVSPAKNSLATTGSTAVVTRAAGTRLSELRRTSISQGSVSEDVRHRVAPRGHASPATVSPLSRTTQVMPSKHEVP